MAERAKRGPLRVTLGLSRIAKILGFDSRLRLKIISTIGSTGQNPVGIEYDSDTKRLYVANGSTGNITVIDPAEGNVVDTVVLTSGKNRKLEAIGFDGARPGFCER